MIRCGTLTPGMFLFMNRAIFAERSTTIPAMTFTSKRACVLHEFA